MYAADQGDRSSGDIDWARVSRRDSARRASTLALLAADGLRTAPDYYHAAMIFQHGSDSTDYRRAHQLATRSVALDSTNPESRWLVAAALDRYLLSIGEPQCYGTQSISFGDGPTYLQPIDAACVTDAERARAGARTLAETRAYLAEVNGTDRGLLIVPDSLLARML